MIGRRQAIGWLAIAPVAASAWSAPGWAQNRFNPPRGPMQLVRTLVRHLSDGKTITVRRGWEIAFEPLGRGYSVAGRQSKVEVDTPPALADLARIEQERVEEAMFPLALDSRGYMIAEASASASADEALARAVEAVQARFAPTRTDPATAAGFEQFVATLRSAGQEMLSHWPTTLFNPAGSAGTIERSVSGPGSLPGTIRVTIAAQTEPITGLMKRLDRTIETQVGDSLRLSQESWTLAS